MNTGDSLEKPLSSFVAIISHNMPFLGFLVALEWHWRTPYPLPGGWQWSCGIDARAYPSARSVPIKTNLDTAPLPPLPARRPSAPPGRSFRGAGFDGDFQCARSRKKLAPVKNQGGDACGCSSVPKGEPVAPRGQCCSSSGGWGETCCALSGSPVSSKLRLPLTTSTIAPLARSSRFTARSPNIIAMAATMAPG